MSGTAMAAPLALHAPAHGPDARLWLLPERAIWWPAEATLFVADVHLGKAAAFRSAGLAVPGGTTRDNLRRLADLVARHRARRLVVLGDLLHARAARTPAVLQALRDWRAAHAGLAWVLVRGNHDDHAGDPPADLGIAVVEEPWPLGPWQCRHEPPAGGPAGASGMALCGHAHPVCVLHGPARERLRLPCFVLTPSALWLPAFGAFTGGHAVAGGPWVVRCALADGAVWPVDGAPPVPWQIGPGR